MKVLIIEDEAPAFRRLQTVLLEINPQIEIIDVIATVEESIHWFDNQEHPDLVFMDIQLSDGISFDIFEKSRVQAPVIFTTAFDEYMLKAFKVNSIDYLLKPIKKEELQQALSKLNNFKQVFSQDQNDFTALLNQIKSAETTYKTRFLIKMGETLISIETSDIAFFQTKNGVVYINTVHGKKYMTDFTLDEVMQQLDPHAFFRVNRQFIIHIRAIEKVHKYHKGKLLITPQLPVEDQMVVSSERATIFKQWLGDK